MDRSHERDTRSSREHCAQGSGSMCCQVFYQRSGELNFVLAAARFTFRIGSQLRGFGFPLVLWAHEAAMDALNRYNSASELFFFFPVLPSLLV